MANFYAIYPPIGTGSGGGGGGSNASVGLTGTTAPTSATELGAVDGSGNLQALLVDVSGNLKTVGALPSGASTSALQTSGNAQLVTIASNQTNGTQVVAVNNFPATQPVSGSVSVSGTVAVSNFPATQPVSGTVAATQSGTWNITNVSGTVSLPTGAATETTLSSINTKTPALGNAVMASSQPVTIASDQTAIPVTGSFSATVTDLNVTGQSAQTATVNNILTAASGSAATDVTGYRSGSVQVVSTGTGGTFIFEGSNDNVNFQTIPVYSQLILTGTPIVAAITPTASQLIYTFPLTSRYVRLRIATTITGGSIQAFSHFSSNAWVPAVMQIAQSTAANLNVTAGTIATVSTITSVASTTSIFTNADQASAAIVVTTTSAAKSLTAGCAVSFNVNVTATAAVSQTYLFTVQTSIDGTNWENAWSAPVRSGGLGLAPYVASYSSPLLNLNGIQYRYIETMSAGVSFTRTITTNRTTQPGLNLRSVTDTAMTGASTSITLHCEGLSNYSCLISGGGGSTPSLFVMDGSNDGAIWVPGIAGGWQATTAGQSSAFNYSGVAYNYIRVRSIGSGSAPNFVLISATDQPVAQPSHAVGQTITNAYGTTNITTGAYVQLNAGTTYETNLIDIADSSGQAMILAIGASGGEVIQAYIPVGGRVGLPLHLPAGTRIAYKALTANATTGFLGMTLYI